MKYLHDYIEKKQLKLFKDMGAFFAFSTKQFNEEKQNGLKYTALGGGLICPSINTKRLLTGLTEITKAGIAEDLAENTKEGVIKRELSNHEAYYTGNIEEVADTLQGYGITRAEVWNVYATELPTLEL